MPAAPGPPQIGWMRQADDTAVPILFRDLDGWALFEGCILLGKTVAVRQAAQQAAAQPEGLAGASVLGFAIVGQRFRWDAEAGVHTVRLNLDLLPPAQRPSVEAACHHWEERTHIRFATTSAKTGAVVHFRPGPVCASYIGCQRQPQEILLAPGCTPGNVMHEIGHAVGLWHEHTRPDRDQYVQVVLSNIQPLARSNFMVRGSDGMALGAYDFGSIMHYPASAFPIDPARPTVLARTGQFIGQREALSPGDVATVAALYP